MKKSYRARKMMMLVMALMMLTASIALGEAVPAAVSSRDDLLQIHRF